MYIAGVVVSAVVGGAVVGGEGRVVVVVRDGRTETDAELGFFFILASRVNSELEELSCCCPPTVIPTDPALALLLSLSPSTLS